MTVAQFRFLPWTRRGLSTRLSPLELTDTPSARADVRVGMTVTGGATSGVDLTLYGPGDVLGFDTRLVVRTDPTPNSTDVEPNYMPIVDLDLPDLPWMFSPNGPDGSNRIRPWMVLICVDAAEVAAPIVLPGTPLPRITIPGDVADRELPDLDDSWAWAHTQVMRPDTGGAVTGDDLADEPALNVSRLMCPRQLEPHRTYHACLVPAYDVGVERGLDGQMPTAKQAGPAWPSPPGETTLPVYFHWTFATGPAGDFETLARKLEPFECPAEVGATPMYVGAPGTGLPQRPSSDVRGMLEMDGALRSVKRSNGTLDDVADDLKAGLRAAVNAPADHADGSPTDTDPIGPPVYAGWHVRRQRVKATGTGFLRELNVDPRRRAGAAIGTALVAHNQEDLVHAAWQQVGDVLEANRLLSLAWLMEDALRRLHERHFQPMPPDRLLMLAAPGLPRMRFDEHTIPHEITVSSLPQMAFDASMRRQIAPQSRLNRTALDAAGVRSMATPPQSSIIAEMATGSVTIDPNLSHSPDGIGGIEGLGDLPGPDARGRIDVARLGIDVSVIASVVEHALAGARTSVTVGGPVVRNDLATTGILTAEHVMEIQRGPSAQLGAGMAAAMVTLRSAVAANPGASVFMFGDGVHGGITALSLEGTEVVAGTGRERRVVAHVTERVAAQPGTETLGRIVAALEPGTLRATTPASEMIRLDIDGDRIITLPVETTVRSRTGPDPTVVGRVGLGAGGLRLPGGGLSPVERIPGLRGPGVRIPGGGIPGGRVPGGRVPADPPGRDAPALPLPSTNTIAAPVKERAVVERFTSAITEVLGGWQLTGTTDAAAKVVPFDVASAATAVLERSAPSRIVQARTRSRLSLSTTDLASTLVATDDRFEFPTAFDRIWAAPNVETPLYELLAAYDRDRFLPGVDVIPPNAVTLVETNPTFIESFMVGVNHEFNAELLWRGFPTDRRGTSMRHFWDWDDRGPDIPPIHKWGPSSSLGDHARGSGQGNIVLLIRGELLRRYPNASIYGWRAEGNHLKAAPDPTTDLAMPVFGGRFDPDFTFAGFALTEVNLAEGDGWFFVIAEQPTEPRFGMDAGNGSGPSWNDLSWGAAGVAPGQHLQFATSPLHNTTRDGLTLAADAAHVAAITLQRPFQIAVHARHLIDD